MIRCPAVVLIVSPELMEILGNVPMYRSVRDTPWNHDEDLHNELQYGENFLHAWHVSAMRIDTEPKEPHPENWEQMTRKEQADWEREAYKNQPHRYISVVTEYGSTRTNHSIGWIRQVVMYEEGKESPYVFDQ